MSSSIHAKFKASFESITDLIFCTALKNTITPNPTKLNFKTNSIQFNS